MSPSPIDGHVGLYAFHYMPNITVARLPRVLWVGIEGGTSALKAFSDWWGERTSKFATVTGLGYRVQGTL